MEKDITISHSQPRPEAKMRIDVQTHHVPETYIKALASRSGYPRFERQGGLYLADFAVKPRDLAPVFAGQGAKP